MKNFTKLLMMVVLLATYSCVQDTTEDLAPTLSGAGSGSGEVKTLQAVLPTPTRTELGDSYVDAEGKTKYPVYWCEDDVLAVNGMPTTSIAVGGRDGSAGKSVAVFDLPLGTTIPYNIVYPYAGEDVVVNAESGMYPVVFKANQLHTEGSFMPGSAPMYAWSNGFENVQMHHLSAVLRFSIKAAAGEKVNLKYVSVSTLGAEPIAGVFDVYCGSRDMNDEKTGSIVAREGANSTVFYNFENDNYELTEEGSVFYVVVPKGDYKSGFEVNFVSQSGEVCVRTFEATGDTKLNGGVVREFPTISEFTTDRQMLLIGNEAEMLAFAKEVNAGTFNSNYTGGALLISDIDMTDKGLKTINGFTSLFEGRNYTIKGLTEPLFGEKLCGTISNLKVEGDIVEKNNGTVGLIVRSLAVNGDKVGKVFNCAAKGSIVYENNNVTVSEELDLINIGGAVGGVYGGEVSITECDVDVTIYVAGPDGDAIYKPCIGGVVGYACASGEALPVVVNNTSAGTIIWDDQSNSTKVVPFIGGVAGYVAAGTFTDNVNAGVLEIREPMYDLDWGGVIGAAATSVERCENKGKLVINEAVSTANIGGVLGLLEANAENHTSIKDCENRGQILLDEKFHINLSVNIGGVVAYASKGTKLVGNCYNSGTIEYKGSCAYSGVNKRDNNAHIHLGGVVGFAWSEVVSDCSNRETANIRVAGAIAGNMYEYSVNYPEDNTGDVESYEYTGIGGVIGSRLGLKTELGSDSAVVTRNCANKGDIHLCYKHCAGAYINAAACIGMFDSEEAIRCSNSGNMLIEVDVAESRTKPTETTNQTTLHVSGILGYIKSENNKIVECDNNGVIKADNCTARIIHMSGITSRCTTRLVMESCLNSKDVVAGKSLDAMFLYVGGLMSSTAEASEGVLYSYCTNTGNVLCEATGASTVYLGGIFGRSQNCNKENMSTIGIENLGKINFTGSSEILYMGGYAGLYEESYHGVEFVNNSSCIVEFNGKVSGEAFVGGYAGCGKLSDGGNFSVRNKGIVISKGCAPQIYVSGGFGYLSVSFGTLQKLGGLVNEGIVEVPAPGETLEFPTDVYLGGVVGYAEFGAAYSTAEASAVSNKSLVDCTNSGEVRYHGLTTNGAYIGGIVGKAVKTPIYNCTNDGKIISTGNAGSLVNRQGESAGKLLDAKQLWYNDLAIGGVVGQTDSNVLLASNNASIEHTCTINPLKTDQWNEVASSRFDIGGVVGRTYVGSENTTQYAITLSGLKNNKDIVVYGSPHCTQESASMDWDSWSSNKAQSSDIDDPDRTNMIPFYRMNLAGVVGRIHDHSKMNCKHFFSNCYNYALVTTPEAALVKNLNIAGILADVLSSYTTFTACENYGAVKVENAGSGTTLNPAIRYPSYFINLGGVVATCFDFRVYTSAANSTVIAKELTFNNCKNHAQIYFGEHRASYCQSAGGILGQAMNLLRNNNWRTHYTNVSLNWLTINLNNCENHGEIKYFSDMVGILTNANYSTQFAGGIVGSCGQATNTIGNSQRFSSIDLNVTGCKNFGNIQFDRSNGVATSNTSIGQSAVGGIVGYYMGGIGQNYTGTPKVKTVEDAFRMEITSCTNSGRIWGFSGYIGGIVGCGKWFVKITGTEDNPTKNTGDIVVARNASAGDSIRRTGYGSKAIYAGGIAGSLTEYYTDSRYMGKNAVTNEGWWPYPLGSQYARVEYAVNEGVVGATSMAGGIVGEYRSLLLATEKIEPSKVHRGGIEHCINNADIYALEGATSQVGLIVGSKRLFTMSAYSSTSADYTADAELDSKVSAESWPVGVKNCQIAGQVLRGANRYTQCNGETYMNLIYGELWNADEFVSIVEGEDNIYDGCHIYTPSTEGGE